MKLQVGEVYYVVHQRKGGFRARVVAEDGEWLLLEVVSGVARELGRDDIGPGEQFQSRRSYCSVTAV